MTIPTEPVAGPREVHGTTLVRSYVAPDHDAEAYPGDIVAYDGRNWDVIGWDTMAPREPDGHQPVRLMLERKEGNPNSKRQKTIHERADARQCTVVGRQVLLPGMPAPPPPEATRDTG